MKSLLAKLFAHSAESAPAPATDAGKPAARRKFQTRKRRPVARGAMRGDISHGLIEQSRRAWGIER